MDDVESFWRRLNLLIKESNTTQGAVSIKCGLNPRRLQNLSAGNRLPDCFEAVRIAAALNTSVEYLVTGVKPDADKQLENLLSSMQSVIDEFKK